MTTVRFFAAAEEFAGRAKQQRHETTLADLHAGLERDYPRLAQILPRCAMLVDGSRRDPDADLSAATYVDVLPPFAGG